MRDQLRDYAIARAVWLYQRLCRAIALDQPAKQRALSDRITRWQRGARREDVHEYYLRTTALDDEAQGNARAEESRSRGRHCIGLIPPEEMAERFTRYKEADDDVST